MESARAPAYDFLGRLFTEGLTPELRGTAEAVPDLAETLPAEPRPEREAAEHHRVLGLEVYPFASYFLDPRGRLSGPPAETARDRREAAGLPAAPNGTEPDHLGAELELLAALGGPDEEGSGGAGRASRSAPCALTFLDEHFLVWAPPCLEAVRRVGGPFHRTVAELVLELVLDHREALAPGSRPLPRPELPLASPPDAPPDPGALAGWLTVPARSGLHLAPSEIRALGRGREVPRGFGSRRRTLTNLLRSASRLGALGGILDDLDDLCASWSAAHERLASAAPWAAPVAGAWRDRVEGSRRLLRRVPGRSPGGLLEDGPLPDESS